MQMKYNDPRFRLTESFADDKKNAAGPAVPDTPEEALKKQFSDERSAAMGVLSDLLGSKASDKSPFLFA